MYNHVLKFCRKINEPDQVGGNRGEASRSCKQHDEKVVVERWALVGRGKYQMHCFFRFQSPLTQLQTQNQVEFTSFRENKFFKQLSIFVVSRSPIQCRSQCYKLLRKHKTYYNIISNFRNAEASPDFNLIYENLRHDPSIKFKGPQEMTQKQVKDPSIMTDK